MPRRRPSWMYKPHKPLTANDNKPEIKGAKSPKEIFIEKKDGSIEVIKEGK